MSGQFSTALMFVSLVAIALAANQAEQNERGNSPEKRGPASLAAIRKEEKIGAFLSAPVGPRRTDKLRGPLKVNLEFIGEQPRAVGDVFVVRGILTTKENVSGVDFSWSLPEGVELVNGEKQGHLNSLATGQPANVELTLKKTADGNVKIHLLAGTSARGGRFADSAQLNSEQAANDKRARMASPGAEKDQLKIFH